MFDPDDTAEYPPVPSYTAQASKLLSSHLAAAGFGEFDPSVLLPVLLDLLARLLKCKPTPQQGYDYLTWKPAARWWDRLWPWAKSVEDRLYDYRMEVADLVAGRLRSLGWSEAVIRKFVVGLWSAVDAGDLTPAMTEGLYKEARG